MSISVICDRCQLAGTAGTGDFSHYGDLLEFEPVPRPNDRVDGWNEEQQRAFIAMLATTGSPHRAAKALGKAPKGAARLREAAGSASFNAAWDRALAIAAKNGSLKISKAVTDAAAKSTQPLTGRARTYDYEPEPEEEMSEEDKRQLFEGLFYKWLGKVEQEREARLAGEVVAADFYLRQVTFFEVTFDLMCERLCEEPWALMSELRRDGHGPMEIAATPVSQMLDAKRRELWAKMGEPERPEYPPARYLIPKMNFSLASEYQALSEEEKELPPQEQERRFKAMHAEDARAQAEWERGAV